jgi:hypothetical protein
MFSHFLNQGPSKSVASITATIGGLIIALAPSASAQQQNRPVYVPPVLERREAEIARQREMRQTDILRERLGKRPLRSSSLVYVHALIAQLKQDFERVQIARNEIVRAMSPGSALDYKFISTVTGEIKKRASRLEDNLALPEPDGDEKTQKNGMELNEEQIRVALSTLCNHIESFVTSPFFETPGVIDVQHSAKASRDLKSILELSGRIKRSATRLKK